jgi:hypothetical protein
MQALRKSKRKAAGEPAAAAREAPAGAPAAAADAVDPGDATVAR